MKKKGKGFKGLGKWISDLWYGTSSEEDSDETKPVAQDLQEAVTAKMQAANAKGDAASVQMISTKNAYAELAKLVFQHDELKKQALLAEKDGDSDKAKRILALALAVKEKMEKASARYESSNEAATQMIKDAQQQFKVAKEASEDLPRRVMQIEVNRMLENASRLEGDAAARIEGKPSYEALAASIDMQTEKHLIGNIIKNSDTMDGEIEKVLEEAQFEEEYKLLQQKVKSGSDIEDAELIEEDGTADRAKKLLSERPFGGLIKNLSGPAISSEKNKH